MWVFEEEVDGRKITEIINTDHINSKYLPGILLPSSVCAISDVLEACKEADILFFVVPHQFLGGVLKQLKGHIKSSAIGVSLIKGLQVGPEGPVLLSNMIQSELNLERGVAVVMGANVANEVAEDQFVESTVGCTDTDVSEIVSDLLDCPCFRTSTCSDVATVELCGALKNIVAMGAGFCDSLGLGSSSKAAVIRKGLEETMAFCEIISGPSFNRDIILQSCGLADCVASSYGGRNRKCAAEFATWLLNDSLAGTDKDRVEVIKDVWREIETRVLGGQKLQGVLTCEEFMACLKFKKLDSEFLPIEVKKPREGYAQYMARKEMSIDPTLTKDQPTSTIQKTSEYKFGLFKRIYAISHHGESPRTLFDW
eukprot:CAMPEP_0119034876 /NCGR_PEP_ID=MMETSP1177-20130426/1900_1 /TAXON_ID=2985 /ORGANISM="Ochromonas sp, Strain CCMP1899" /LENGTH=367 /DNA_ID=CAMNT_0006992677 /DNA_START=274 /DNA_END=1377 /DNA_ORIENTATION=-